jgi:hypothetical protein
VDSQDDYLIPVYGPDDLRAFAEMLGIPELTPVLVEKLQHAAWLHEFMHQTDEWRATRRERRSALKSIQKTALALKAALEKHSTMIVDEKIDLPPLGPHVLDALASAAATAAKAIPPTGGYPKHARRLFVSDMGEIFKKATGKPLTLSRDRHGKPGGLFYEFVEAALGKLDRSTTQGLETDVRTVIRQIGKLDT